MIAKHFERALAELGTKEIQGAKDNNPRILSYLAYVLPGETCTDEIAWCSAFMNWCFEGQGTRKANARSWLAWGQEVALDKAQAGDVVVFWRNSPEGWEGHVGLYMGLSPAGDVMVLGGNQGNMVCVAPYAKERLLGVRRYLAF